MSQFNHVISSTTASSISPSSSPSPPSSLYMKSSIKDIYTLRAYDVQVFIEKRGNIFNFHLLDPRLDLPTAQEVLENIGYYNNLMDDIHIVPAIVVDSRNGSVDSDDQHNQQQRRDTSVTPAISKSKDELEHNDDYTDLAETKANEIVKSIVNAVSTLGNAVHEGGQSGLSVALKNQKDGFVR